MSEQGFNEYKVMDDLGKTLIMRKVMEQCKDKLTIYKSKTSMPGFAEKMKTIVSEFKQYGITDDVLNNMKAECDSKPLLRHNFVFIKPLLLKNRIGKSCHACNFNIKTSPIRMHCKNLLLCFHRKLLRYNCNKILISIFQRLLY